MQGNVGAKIREARKAQGLTLQDLSERSGLSISQLSKLETGKARLTVDTALVIAGVLHVPVGALLFVPRGVAKARRSITRAGTGVVHRGNAMSFEVLCSDFRDKANIFWRVTLHARSFEENGGWRSHAGEEFIYVQDGSLELHTIHYDPVVLNPGDSIQFDGEMDHAYVALGDKPVVMLMSNSVPGDAGVVPPGLAEA
ncbi:helix-turn-helix domain-containing protein [Amorphus sp. 3PC139-8]|uniref:helix-turn-helix domain-containing protein n=1 Tax=Amorphus sp. 3PC139-8 TaxID=2735676 RepID=UPI00345D5A9B